MLTRLSIVAVAMFGFGFALVPFYRAFCEAVGVNSLVERDAAPTNSQVDPSRLVTIEFDANVRNMPWRFRPVVGHVQVHPGQLVQVEYEVSNSRAMPVTGQAIASFGPELAGRYFKKLECFCFQDRVIGAHEQADLPVVYFVDPDFARDPETRGIDTLTLSYTYFRSVNAPTG